MENITIDKLDEIVTYTALGMMTLVWILLVALMVKLHL